MARPPVIDIDLNQFKSDPYPALAELRKESPIAYVPQLGSILFTRRDDIATAEKNVSVFSSHQPEGLMNKLMGHNMMRKDGSDHQQEKKAIFPSMSPATVRDYWTNVFQHHADEVLEHLAPAGHADLVRQYALPFSANCLRSLTGLTNVTAAQMDSASQHMIDGIANYTGQPEIEAKCNRATALLDEAIKDKMASAAADSEPSLLGVMQHAGMPIESICANIKLAISGGQNEPRDAIAGASWALLSHPDQLAAVNSGTASWLNVFEEYARWISPIGMSPRRIAKDYCFSGINLLQDERVFFMFGAANRDHSCFTNPDQFDLTNDTSKSIAFGAGPHFCAGAWASRAMIADVALPALFKRFKNLRIDDQQPQPMMEGWAFRGLLSLPVTWS